MKNKKISFFLFLVLVVFGVYFFINSKNKETQPENRVLKKEEEKEHLNQHGHDEHDHFVPVKKETSKNLNQSFPEFLKETKKHIPTFKNFKPTEEEAHHTPSSITGAAAMIGQVLEEVDNHPHYQPQAESFFKDCVKEKEILPSMRALCLDSLLMLKDEVLDEQSIELYTNDPEVKRLTLELQGL